MARVVAAVTALSFLGWVFSPITAATPWLGLVFGLFLGASAGIALFAFTYALSDIERLLGTAITVLFSLISQIIFSLPALWNVSGPLYLGAQVLTTLICLMGYRPGDYLDQLSTEKPTG